MKRATNFGRENLLSLGTRLGKFSKKGKFRLHITALNYLAPYAKYKVRARSLAFTLITSRVCACFYESSLWSCSAPSKLERKTHFSRRRCCCSAVLLILCLAALGSTQVWVKPNTEQSFLYGNHVAKAGLGRMTENTPKYQGVVVYNMNDVPLVSAPLSNTSDRVPIPRATRSLTPAHAPCFFFSSALAAAELNAFHSIAKHTYRSDIFHF